jgi:hypothetical protein
VSEKGRCSASRAQRSRSASTETPTKPAARWLFRPLSIDGHRVKFTGEFIFHFEDSYDKKWQETMRNSPPNR